jgi:GR25 family glycosyltransferase involved in LPS biosynthesis
MTHKISLVLYVYYDYPRNIKNVLDSFGTLIKNIYLLCFDNINIDELIDYPIPITYIELSKYGYNINRCFNDLTIKYIDRIWILWRPYFIFHENKTHELKTLINKISTKQYNIVYIYGLNLLIDVLHVDNSSMYICRNGGCFIADSSVKLIENNDLYIVDKRKLKIFYNIYDKSNTEYYFFNFAKACHNSYMLADIFEHSYLNSIRDKKEYLNFVDWYEKKGQTIICGKKYNENRLISSLKQNMIFHNITLTPALQSINYYVFDGISRIQKLNNTNRCVISDITNTNFYNYNMTIITLVRNNSQYLRTAMESLINQTSNNWNCVIVNDGSFNSVSLSDFIDPKDTTKMNFKDRFKIINLSEWNGLVKCHKTALLHATYDIIGILDVDDALDPTAIQQVLNLYNKTKEDNIYVYTNFYYCDINMKKTHCGYSAHVNSCLLHDKCASAFRTFKLKHYYLTEGYDDDLQFGAEDQDILFKLENICTPIFLDAPLYFYRHDAANNMTITSLKKLSKWSLFISVLKNIKSRYNNNDFQLKIFSNKNPSELKKYYSYRMGRNQYVTGIKSVIYGDQISLSHDKDNDNVKLCNVNLNKYDNHQDVIYHIELYSNNIYFINILDPMFKFDTQIISDFIYQYNSNITNNTFNVNIDWDVVNSQFFINNNTHSKIDIPNFVRIHPNLYFDHIYILNLHKDVKKRERMRDIFESLNMKYEFFDAVYGNDVESLTVFNNKKYYNTLKSPGAYGYTLSMINIFNDALKNKYKKILVCDDDIIFHKNFLNLFDKNIRHIPFDWKVLFFGMSGPWTHPFINKDFKIFNYSVPYIKDTFNCEGSYCVGYDILILRDLINVANKFESPFDTSIMKYLNLNPTIIKYSFQPYLVIADTTKSDISTREKNIMKNFEEYQFKYRQNLGSFDLDTILFKSYNMMYRNPYPLVSIILITCNENKYLGKSLSLIDIDYAIKSILNQTYKNIELIVIENSDSNKYNTQY